MDSFLILAFLVETLAMMMDVLAADDRDEEKDDAEQDAANGKKNGRRRRSRPTGSYSSVRRQPKSEIVLLCNPQAGGRWKELGEILDSEEARGTRRIVTDSVSDIGPALSALGRKSELLFVYGGDGTIQRILDRISPKKTDDIRLALIGGGTMNVTARWCGMTPSPVENFRSVIHAYRTGHLLLKEVPLLEVRQGKTVHRGFTFGMGPLVRLLDHYESGRKGKASAVWLGVRSLLSVWTGRPAELTKLTEQIPAEVLLDGDQVPYDRFTAVFANTTGQINPYLEPFANQRSRDTFHTAAYSVSAREFTLVMPLLYRGWLPLDPIAMLSTGLRKQATAMISKRRLDLTRDARYVNKTSSTMEIRTPETLYTVDGELFHAKPNEPIQVELGSVLKLAVSPLVALEPAVRLAAARAIRGR